MSAPQQPAGSTATAETTSDDALSPAPDAGSAAHADLPDPDQASDDAVVDDVAPEAAETGLTAATAPGAASDTDEDTDDDADDDADEEGDDPLVREGDVAGDYLERLLDILDVDGDIDLDVEGDRASVAIVGGRLGDLVGPGGATLDALQELTRLAVAQSTGVRSRLMLDIGGFRAKRRADLTALAGEAAQRVSQSRAPERLSPMNPFERKVVHDVIAGVAGVHSESEGEEPQRRVVVLPDK
jgi:spoIIIJ-associated protein